MSSLDSALDAVVVAYDIDGALTKKSVRDGFIEDSNTKKVTPGVITSRSKREMDEFFAFHPDILVNSEFNVPARVKVTALRNVKAEYPWADKYIYKGSWVRDKLAAKLAGWEYSAL